MPITALEEEIYGKLPAPPFLDEFPPLEDSHCTILEKGAWVFRIYNRGGAYPSYWNDLRFYGPTNNRFDHQIPPPELQNRGIYYGASQLPTCIAEVFQETRVVDRAANSPYLVGFQTDDDIQLLNLRDSVWPTLVGCSMAINSGPRSLTKEWSRAVYEAYPEIKGLLYASSMYQGAVSYAFYERAKEQLLPAHPSLNKSLNDPDLLLRINGVATSIGYAVI